MIVCNMISWDYSQYITGGRKFKIQTDLCKISIEMTAVDPIVQTTLGARQAIGQIIFQVTHSPT
jgi:hypothetical protein